MTETRTRRTPAEILADAEAKAAAARMKVAKDEAKSSPEAKAILDELAELRKAITADNKLLGDGPQSAAARIALKHQRIAEIEEAAEQAELRKDDLTERKAALESQLDTLVETLAENMANGTDDESEDGDETKVQSASA